MANWRSLASQLVRRYWIHDNTRKCGVAVGLLVGATVGSVVWSDNSHGKDFGGQLNPISIVGKPAAWIHEAFCSPVLISDDAGTKWVETVFSTLRRLVAGRMSIAYLEPGAADLAEDSTSKSTDIYLTRHTIADAVAKAAPAVVNITVSIAGLGIAFGQTTGSGFIIDAEGTILTNAHVVAGDRSGPYKGKMVVTMQDGRTFPGEIINYDLLADIAVIKVHSSKPLPTVKFGSSRKVRLGEWVVAVGSPFHLQNSVTVGIISCVDRKSSEMGLRGVHADYLQTDAAINQGSSGGPLLNLDGEVIGINTMKAIAADGVSFAIPIDSALRIIQQLKKHGRVVRPWLGMKMIALTDDIVSQLKEKDPSFPDVKTGVLIPQVIPGSPAEQAGVRAGDVIVEFDGRPISNTYQIVEALDDKIGVPFKALIRRGGSIVQLSVITEEASPSL